MDIKDIQIDILTKTIGNLHRQLAEMSSALIVLQNQKNKEVKDGEHQDSAIDECDND